MDRYSFLVRLFHPLLQAGLARRTVKTIELNLTPQQVVVLWLRNALQAGTFEEGARRTPPPREAVGNAVRNTVRNSVKGQEASLVERAILQARQEADLLYLLVIEANGSILRRSYESRQSLMLVNGHLQAVGCALGHGVEDAGLILRLRSSLVVVVEDQR